MKDLLQKHIITIIIFFITIISVIAILINEPPVSNLGGYLFFIKDLIGNTVVSTDIPLIETTSISVDMPSIENQKQPDNSRHVYIVIIGCLIGTFIWLKGLN